MPSAGLGDQEFHAQIADHLITAIPLLAIAPSRSFLRERERAFSIFRLLI